MTMTAADAQPALPESWCRVAGSDALDDGAIKPVVVAGKVIVLIRIGECYGALDNCCPHAGGPLAEGALENGRLICPWHGREYDPFTGQCDGYEQSVRAFKVDVRPDGVYVAL